MNIAATIMGQTFRHDGTITIDQVFKFFDAVNANGEYPTYLFLNEKDEAILSELVYEMSKSTKKPNHHLRNFLLMRVIVLPTLPENTLIIGKLVLERETPFVQLSGEQAQKQFQVLYDLQNTTRPEGLD